MFWRQAVVWTGWALISPLVVSAVFRIQKVPSLLKRGLLHTISTMAFTLGYAIILSALSLIFFESNNGFRSAIVQNIVTGTAANLLVYALIVAFALMLIFYQKSRQEQELKLQLNAEKEALEKLLVSAQLEALKMQVQPHFLFNALNAISSLVRKGENGLAIDTIAKVSELLRASLKNHENHQIKLEEELQLIDRYLDIEKVRFDKNLKTELYFDDQAKKVSVPAFILQPLVENCFKHAFKNNENGVVSITGLIQKDTLQITVTDNGSGLPGGFEIADQKGVGLKNVNDRIKRIYQEKGGLKITSNGPKGTSAIVSIPVQHEHTE